MRQGQNPLKRSALNKVKPPEAITVGVLNYIPDQTGYHEQSLESLKLCLTSIRANADKAFDLLVVDNGSCPDVKEYLLREFDAGKIQFLILNQRNIGKPNGLMQVLRSAPGDYVFYSDGDVYHYSKWMSAQLEVFEAFPNVGIAGAIPIRSLVGFHTKSTHEWVMKAPDEISVKFGHFIPDEWTRDFARSIGLPGVPAAWGALQDCLLEYRGLQAYVGSTHFQFLTSKSVINRLPNLRVADAMGQAVATVFDESVDEDGLLRLSTARPYVTHIGNRIDESWLISEYKRLVDSETELTAKPMPQGKSRLKRNRIVRKIATRIYQGAYDVLYR